MPDAYYDEAAAKKQEKVAQSRDMVRQREVTRDLLALRTGEAVLDVGSGNGILAREMVHEVGPTGSVTGVDPAPPMVAMAARICPQATFLEGGADALPVDSEQFDVVTASQVLCFVPDIDAALAEMRRVLKPSGRVVLLDTDWDSLVWHCRHPELLARVLAELKRPYGSSAVPKTLSRRLTDAGFQITGRIVHPIVNWSFSDDAFSRQMSTFLPGDPNVPADARLDGPRWFQHMAELDAAGEYMFSINRYLFAAAKV
ncbi:MAG: methyltransferase domain-containing protein [Pseudomonadota bacterium]